MTGRIAAHLKRLRGNVSGLATIELALSLPLLLTAGLWGVELANYGVVTMKVNQLAAQIADDASRIGDTSTIENQKIYEGDIDDLLHGANLQGGKSIDLFNHGRVIVSSLEVNSDGNQYIHWQRCMGVKRKTSAYGVAGDVMPDGMGPTGREVIASDGEAVIFVEVAYDYQPLVSSRFVGTPLIDTIASFTVRPSRDLSQVYQRNAVLPDAVADCNAYTNPYGAGT